MHQNVAVIGASGKIGSKIIAELLSRGHQVTGIARNPERIKSATGMVTAKGDFTDPDGIIPVLRGHDAIIGATTFLPGQMEKLIESVRDSGVKRFLMVGGAASLQSEEGGPKIFDTLPALSPPVLDQIREGMRTLELLRGADDLLWTFLSPAVMIGPGERTGKFRLGKDVVVKDAKGNSSISYDDFAIAMVDELELNRHLKSRFTLGY